MSEPSSRKDLTNIQILALALFTLGGDERAIDTEVIAVKAHEMAPGRFSWRMYPEQISLESVRRNLGHAKKPENGTLAGGSASRGWHLTPKGVGWAKDHLSVLDDEMVKGRGQHDKEAARRRNLHLSRIFDLPAWQKHQQGDLVSRREAEAIFRLSEYVTGTRREMLIDRTLSLFSEDRDVGLFISDMAKIVRDESEAIAHD